MRLSKSQYHLMMMNPCLCIRQLLLVLLSLYLIQCMRWDHTLYC